MGPREDLFNAIKAAVGKIDIIAEDLVLCLDLLAHVYFVGGEYSGYRLSIWLSCWQGIITKDVVDLRKAIGAPGMAVLQFGTNCRGLLKLSNILH